MEVEETFYVKMWKILTDLEKNLIKSGISLKFGKIFESKSKFAKRLSCYRLKQDKIWFIKQCSEFVIKQLRTKLHSVKNNGDILCKIWCQIAYIKEKLRKFLKCVINFKQIVRERILNIVYKDKKIFGRLPA
jgi:hypothetical protein